MKRLASVALLVLLVLGIVPVLGAGHAQGSPLVNIESQYIIDRYGFATVNETVTYVNNESSTAQVPAISLGFGNLSSLFSGFAVEGSGYSVSNLTGSGGNLFAVSGGGQSIAAGGSSSFSFKALVKGITSQTSNGTLKVLILTRPFFDLAAERLVLEVKMPLSTQFKASPPGFLLNYVATNVTYTRTVQNATSEPAVVQHSFVQQFTGQDFHPLEVYHASRMITTSASGNPVVRDTLTFKNLGTTPLQTLYVSALTSPNGKVTVLPSAEPPLLGAATVSLAAGGLALSNTAIGFPIGAGSNFTITYQYPLQASNFTVSGGVVGVTIPLAPPIPTFVDSYTVGMSLPGGVSAVQGSTRSLTNVTPWQTGETSLSYGLSIGWALQGGVPAASLLFALVLVGIFASRSTMTAEEESEDETGTDRVSAMIKAFEEKTSLINGLFEEIPAVDPNQLDKEYFDELRGRLDAFRGRALQRLNEVKQKSTTQKFFELLNQIHNTEREIDRAAKDMLNLYEQFYTRRMRKEVFDRLKPSYKKRLEKSLNQLSDELNVAQKEAKLL